MLRRFEADRKISFCPFVQFLPCKQEKRQNRPVPEYSIAILSANRGFLIADTKFLAYNNHVQLLSFYLHFIFSFLLPI